MSRVPELMSLLLLLLTASFNPKSLFPIQPQSDPLKRQVWLYPFSSLRVEAPVLTKAYRPYTTWFPVPTCSLTSFLLLLLAHFIRAKLASLLSSNMPHTPALKLLQVPFPLLEHSSSSRCTDYLSFLSFHSWAKCLLIQEVFPGYL